MENRSSSFFTRHHRLNIVFTIILAVCVVLAVAAIIYLSRLPGTSERFTEFYILGRDGKADRYAVNFLMTGNKVTGVNYSGEFNYFTPGDSGRVILGIVNREYKKVSYSISLQIDGAPVDFTYQGRNIARLDGIMLDADQKWEQAIGFAPVHIGDHQKVEFLLYEDGLPAQKYTLHLFINALAGQS